MAKSQNRLQGYWHTHFSKYLFIVHPPGNLGDLIDQIIPYFVNDVFWDPYQLVYNLKQKPVGMCHFEAAVISTPNDRL